MKTPDLDTMTLPELRALAAAIDVEIARRPDAPRRVGIWSDPIGRAERQATRRRRFIDGGKP